jgi:proteic killer suppression protein
MDLRFDDDDLERLERDANFTANRGEAIVTAFRRRIQAIRAASNEQDLRAMKSFHFEKLSGNRRHQYSIRLNKQS